MNPADRCTVADLEDDPYPLYAWLRAHQPVAWVPAVELWMVTRWDDVERVTKDPQLFTAAVDASPVDRCFGSPTIITCDGETHRELRRATDPKYRPARVNSYIDDLVRPLAEQLVGQLRPQGGADLMTEYFEPISTLALARSMGFTDVDVPTLQRWFRGLSNGATNFEQDPGKQRIGDETAAEIRRHTTALFERMETDADDSALSHMLHDGMRDGETRPREFLLPTILVTLLGGMQEPGHGAGSVLVGLLSHPEQLSAVRADPDPLLLRAVDEGLRWIAPIGTQTRQATRDVELGGVTVPAGQTIAAVVASACRDESRYREPDRFDVFRSETEHAAFGFGNHYCTGHWFARHQVRIALDVLLAELPALRFVDGFVPSFVGWEFRAPTALPVRW
ncbi:MAG: cytochrome P450 [Acidimicrobiia bacterium]